MLRFLCYSGLAFLALFTSPLISPALAAEPSEAAFDEFNQRYATRILHGWKVQINVDLLNPENQEISEPALRLLEEKLGQAEALLPREKADQLRGVTIWMELNNHRSKGEYHPNLGWIKENKVNPAKWKSIEFGDARFFIKAMDYQPMIVLHELAHAYHHQVLGFELKSIQAAFREVMLAKSYHQVKRHDGKVLEAYALTNHKEYFAETTEAYFGQNDFYPFDRDDLRQHDPRMYALLEEIWSPGAP